MLIMKDHCGKSEQSSSKGKTAINIAHQIVYMVKRADKIIVLAGKLVEEGSQRNSSKERRILHR